MALAVMVIESRYITAILPSHRTRTQPKSILPAQVLITCPLTSKSCNLPMRPQMRTESPYN